MVGHLTYLFCVKMDRIFRPLLLDGITMLELTGEESLAGEFRNVQKDFLSFMRGPKNDGLSFVGMLTCNFIKICESD